MYVATVDWQAYSRMQHVSRLLFKEIMSDQNLPAKVKMRWKSYTPAVVCEILKVQSSRRAL